MRTMRRSLACALLGDAHFGRHETRRFVSQTSPARPLGPRPALGAFAAITLIMLGGFELVFAITNFFRFAFGALPNIADVLDYSVFWGILDVFYAIVLLYSGYAAGASDRAAGRLDCGGLRRNTLVLLPVVCALGLDGYHRHLLAHHLWTSE
jgi:hypothetical protein